MCEGFMTTTELAAAFGVREQTVIWWEAKHLGPEPTVVHGRVVYLIDAVDRWVAQLPLLALSSPSLAVALVSSASNSSTSLASVSVFADGGAAA